ncbi:phage head-tail connector protein [Marinococcus halophilus]|uniref:phage head-tail connector protein n=1 Tax=Marinococcus halophilus TaxID=1371 RepID=UPI0009A7DC05|nr:phage head-tail connector protein [Marinococcus halophilus]
MREDVKKLLGITDTLQDAQIDLIIKHTQAWLTLWFKNNTDLTTVPPEIEFIIVEVAVKRFNRLGSEGMSKENVEGHSVTYKDDDFAGYMHLLFGYLPDTSGKQPGSVMFF